MGGSVADVGGSVAVWTLASGAGGSDKAALSLCFPAPPDCEVTFFCDGLSHPGITNTPPSLSGFLLSTHAVLTFIR